MQQQRPTATDAGTPDAEAATQPSSRRTIRGDLIAAFLGVLLVGLAFATPHLHYTPLLPLINSTSREIHDFAQAAPIFGWWNAHVGPGTAFAVLLGVAGVVWGPALALRLRWPLLVLGCWAGSAAWAMSLAMIDGWQRGFAGRLTKQPEYLTDVPRVTDIPDTLHHFASHIRDFQPDSWTTHVSGHPPGALLTFVWLDRIGLGGGAWAAGFVLLVGSSAAAAVVVAIRFLDSEDLARRAAPFAVLAPTAIWIAVSADGYFAAVSAWGLALLAIATTRRAWSPSQSCAAVGAGLLLGWSIYLNYGLALVAIPALAVLVISRNYRPLLGALIGALAVAGVFTGFGFWWFDGYTLVQQRYWQGIAMNRPFSYWVWADLAALACAVGPASCAALNRVLDWSALRARCALPTLAMACLLAVVAADLSGLSKAETERIWLPFAVVLVSTPALLPTSGRRWWLASQCLVALAVNSLILTNW